jgi:hypothetical protein
MKKKLFAIILTVLMLAGTTATALAAGTGDMDRDKTQLQTKDQTCIDQEDQDLLRQQLRDRLHITDPALDAQQDRLRDCDQSCDGSFTDTALHWGGPEIDAAYQWGFVNGYPDGSFRPDKTISGIEGILMMSRMTACLSGIDEEASEDDVDWNDVPDWAAAQLREQSALRIEAQSQLYGEGELTRLQFALMLANALGIEPAEVTEDTVVFLDQDEIPAGALGFIYALRTMGIMEGSGGYFHPDQPVTRAEAAATLCRVMGILE